MRRISCWISIKLIFLLLLSGCTDQVQDSSNVTAFDVSNGPISNAPINDRRWTTKYDTYFNKYSKRYFGPGFEFRWFKAQGMAESALKADAESWVGAKGIMQVMPATFAEIKQHNKYIIGDLADPRWNIEAGIYYDHRLFNSWKSKRPFKDRLAFMFASYNAGMGNVLKGQKVCKELTPEANCNLWQNIEPVAHKVSSWRSEETLGYVKRIFGFMGKTI